MLSSSYGFKRKKSYSLKFNSNWNFLLILQGVKGAPYYVGGSQTLPRGMYSDRNKNIIGKLNTPRIPFWHWSVISNGISVSIKVCDKHKKERNTEIAWNIKKVFQNPFDNSIWELIYVDFHFTHAAFQFFLLFVSNFY